jgi:hypothetical protein
VTSQAGADRGKREIRLALRAAKPIAAAETPAAKGKTISTETNASRKARKPNDGAYDVEAINREYALVLMGSRAIIIKQTPSGPIDERQRVLTIEAFGVWLGNCFLETRSADGKVKVTTWAKAWLNDRRRRQYAGIEFFPDPNNAPGTPGYLNLWRGFSVKPIAKANGYRTFHDHLLNNVCAGDEALFAWLFGLFAHAVQRPRERIGVALVLRGKMGSGKTIVGEVFGSLFAAHYFLVDDPRYVTGQFNAHMASCILLQADEAVWAGDKAAEGRLKGLITSPKQQIEAKGVDPIPLPNYVRLVMTSNEGWVVPAGKDERRFAVLDVDPRCASNHSYFAEMTAELDDGGREALLYDLLHFDLNKVDVRTIPKTMALLDQKERSLDSVASWWLGRLEAGTITRHATAWHTGRDDSNRKVAQISREALFSDYLETSDRIGVKRRREQTIFGRELHDLVPGLRTDRQFNPDGKRERVYVLPTLAECRSSWDESMNQTREWPPEDDPEAGESAAGGEF